MTTVGITGISNTPASMNKEQRVARGGHGSSRDLARCSARLRSPKIIG
jgi:hypothetical protein